MKKKSKNIHRGEILKEVVKNSHIKITQLVKKMGISRGTYYNHVDNANLPFEILYQYGKVLNHDFTQNFPEIRRFIDVELEVEYGIPKNLEEAVEQIDYWKKKYIKLLERFNEIMGENFGSKNS